MGRSKELETGSIPGLLLKFSVPAIVGMVVQALYNVVDRIFIGQAVGSLGIAGLTIAFPIMLIVMAFGMLVGLGATALISLRLGARQKAKAEQALGNALVLQIGISLVITVVGLSLLTPLLTLLGASEAVLPVARDYTRIILVGAVLQGIGFGLNNVIRGEGNPRIAMFTMLIGAALNTVLDPIFIFGFGWGIEGAAIATVLSQAVTAVWVLRYFLNGDSVLKIRVENLRPRWPVCRAIFVIGAAPFAMQLGASLLNTIMNHQLSAHGGDVAVSVMGIFYSVVMLIMMPIIGISQGAQPIIGFNYGAEHFDRVKKTLLLATVAATVLTTFGFAVTMLLPTQIIRLFDPDDPVLIQIGTRALRICTLMLPIVGFQIISSNYFQAVGKAKTAMFLSLSRQVLLLIPCLLICPRFFGLDGVWMSLPISDIGSSVLTGVWLFLELRSLGVKHGQVEASLLEESIAPSAEPV